MSHSEGNKYHVHAPLACKLRVKSKRERNTQKKKNRRTKGAVGEAPIMRLATFPMSHYCEVARWALDYHGLPFVEEPYAPVLHRVFLSGSVPQLYLPDGVALRESMDIVAWASEHGHGTRRLGPVAPEHEALLRLASDSLGRATRRWAYTFVLDHRPFAFALMSAGLSSGQYYWLKLSLWWVAPLMKKAMGATPEGAATAMTHINAAFDAADVLMADGRRWLSGDSFDTLDLVWSALTSPVLMPDGHELYARTYREFGASIGAALTDTVERLRARPSGQVALRAYAERRVFGTE